MSDLDLNIYHTDARTFLRAVPPNTYDFVVTDNPYGLVEMTKRFGKADAKPAKFAKDGAFTRASRGFMGKAWDGSQIETDPSFWRLVYDAMKPGAHLLAFGGSRTFHRIAVAIEDAGFVLRDSIQVIGWTYDSGFPKSEDVSKAIDLAAFRGWVTRYRPWLRKRRMVERLWRADPLSDPRAYRWQQLAQEKYLGTVEGLRTITGYGEGVGGDNLNDLVRGAGEVRDTSDSGGRGVGAYGVGAKQKRVPIPRTSPATDGARTFDGYGSALCPSWEAVLCFQKPIEKGLSIAANCEKWGTGALNLDACRYGNPKTKAGNTRAFGNLMKANLRHGYRPADYYAGKDMPGYASHPGGYWPKNTLVIHHPACRRKKDGSWRCVSACAVPQAFGESARCFMQFPAEIPPSTIPACVIRKPTVEEKEQGLEGLETSARPRLNPGGLSHDPRWEPKPRLNPHATVKPVALMRYLLRLVVPPVRPGCAPPLGLDPFCGSGTTLVAAAMEGVSMDGVEMEADSARVAEARVAWAKDYAEHGQVPLLAFPYRQHKKGKPKERAASARARRYEEGQIVFPWEAAA